jgi:hypothetical protein
MLWLVYGTIEGLSPYFWAKMVFVVILSASVGVASSAAKRVRGGDASAMGRVKVAGMINGISGLAIILCAVFAFN